MSRQRYDYIRDPSAIYDASFAIVRSESNLTRFPDELHPVVERLVHTCGRPEIADALVVEGPLAAAGVNALKSGKPVFADVEMVVRGVTRSLLPADNEIICTLNDAQTPAEASTLETTRSAAAVEAWGRRVEGAIVAIGNAPTALFHFLEKLHDGWPRPAAILAFPVGFVGAAESKQALRDADLDIPFITLPGREGGSALAAAAVNGLAVAARGDAVR